MIPRHLGRELRARRDPSVRLVGLDVDVSPRRSVAGVNIRRDEKPIYDALLAWWSVERGRTLTQWEAFSILLSFALTHPELRLPPEVERLME
jgi:hypothetical protein